MTYVGAEPWIIDQWVHGKLAGQVGLVSIVSTRIFNGYAPDNTAFPYVIFQQQTLSDVIGVGVTRVMVSTLYVVKAIGQGPDFAGLAAVAAQIDLAMTSEIGGIVTGGQVLASVREEPFALTEIEDGKQFRHLGGVYRIHAQAT